MKRLTFFLSAGLLLGIGMPIAYAALPDAISGNPGAASITMPVKDIQRFATAVAQIKRFYIEPVDDEKLFNYAIKGMLSNLDPHSDFLDEDDLNDLQAVTTGKFGGVGIEVMPDTNGFIKVISPIDDTPAAKAGIKTGDLIIRINGKLVKDMSLRESINMIRGESGTTVDLVMLRKGEKRPLRFKLKREAIKVKTVKTEMLDKNYGYIRIALFQSTTKQDLMKAIEQLQKQSGGHLSGIILDLRNDPGGLLDAAVEVTNTFLDSDKLKYDHLIVYTKGRIPDSDMKAKATGKDILAGIPMVVLINQGSASASEIVAGALQDHRRAIIMGTRSFGKGSVQTVLPIDDRAGIKLTTALYYTPKGRSIQAKGIEPDVVVSEVKFANANSEDALFDSVAEADLNGHLANGNPQQTSKTPGDKGAVTTPQNSKMNDEQIQQLLQKEAVDGKSKKDLLRADFQLYEAVNLLKAMHAVREEGKS